MPTYTGTNGDNTINGSNGDDTINGLGGNDTINGGNGDDTIDGGADDDVIDGGNSNDTIQGGSGEDTIDGGNGNDSIDGGDDDDVITGGNGNDNILGGAGNDNLTGNNGNDDFTGGGGDDVIDGSNGFDTARYSGPIGDYSFYSAGGYLHVVHLGGAGPDGHDRLIRVERLIFADRVIDIGSGNNAPVAGDDHVFINEDTGVYSSGAASVMDNDFDFEGQPLTVTPGVFVGTYGTLTLNANGTYSYALFASAQALDDGENVQDSFNYTVSDGTGTDTGALVFHIAGLNDAPVANDDTASTTEDAVASGNVLANDTDVDGETLTAVPGTYVGTYGTLVLAADGSYTYTPGAAAQALDDGEVVSDAFSYTASDGTASDMATLTVTVTGLNDAPVANDDTASTTEDAGVSGNVLANDTDVDGETLTVTNPGTYVGTYGTLTLAADGSYTYTPNPAAQALDDGEVVSDAFSYTASDGTASDTATLTVTVNGLNDAPVANDDTASTTEDAVASGNVLANDTDVDGETLTVANPGTYVGAYGTLVLAADGSYTYTPNAAAQALDDGEVVSDAFSYTASDGTASDTATLTVTVNGLNDAPVANDDSAATTEEAAVTGNVLTNDSDVDGEPLTVANPGTYVGAYGTLVLAADGSYTYTPNPAAQALDDGEVVSDAFSYTASDGTASDTATLTVTVNGLNDAPVANDDTASTTEDAAASGNVLANDTDVDGETLLVANPGTYVGAYGTLILAADGSYTYTPGATAQALDDGEVVSDAFSYTASDGTASDTATLTVTVNGLNDAPVANDDTASTTEDAAASGNVLTNDTDVDGETLTVTNPGTYVGIYGTLTLAADGSYSYAPNAAANGLAAGEVAQDAFAYTASDGTASDTATLTVTVTGTNDAPTIDAGGTDDSGSVTELPNNDPNENTFNHQDSGTVAFDDLDLSDTHSASFTPQAGGYLGSFTLDPVDQMGDSVGWDFNVSDAALDSLADGQIVTQVYTIEIDDGHGGTALQDVTITITGAADGPQTVWYIDNSSLGANLGTQADPYTSIAAFNAAQGTPGGPQVGATVYLLAGTGTYAEADGINLLDDQILTGVGQPTIAPLAGNGVDLAQNNTLSGFDIVTTTGIGIADGAGSVGNLSVSDVAVSGSAQIADIDQGGTLNVTLNSAASTSSSGGAIDLASVGGSFTITGATTIVGVHSGGGIDITGSSVVATFGGGGTVSTAGATGVNYVGNSGSLTIGGGFDIVTTSGAGLNASGGGTVTVTGAGNSVSSTTGTAVTISGTDIGLAGITFESVSANGAVNGILLSNTGTNAGVHGGLTITGDAGSANNGSGGTIQNTTGAGISLTNTRDTNLDQVIVQNGLDDGIRGTSVTNFTLTNSTVTNNGNASGEHGADFGNLLGAGTFTDTVFSSNEASQVLIVNTSGTASLAFTGFSASSNGLAAAPNGLHGLHVETQGTASADLLVLDSAFNNLFSNSVHAINQGTGTLEVTVATTDFNNVGASAINIVQNSSGTVRFYIHDNDTFLRGTNSGTSASININQAGAVPAGAVMEGAISDNVIGDNSSSTSATTSGDGIRVFSVGAGTTTVRIDGNGLQGVGGNGINVQMSGSANPAHTMNVTMFDNVATLTAPGSFDGIRVVAGAAAGNAGILRLDMHDNIASSMAANDFQVRQRFATTVQLLNYVGASTDTAAVQAYLDVTRNNDPTGAGTDWFISTQAPGGGFVNTASVPQPTLPSPLLASGAPPAGHIIGEDNVLSQADVDQLTAAAIQRWAESGATAEQLAAMRAVSVTVADMAGPFAGSSHSGEIRLDSDGAGFGWFIDTTPGEDGEFEGAGAHLSAEAGGAAEGRLDALTVLMHELGHQIGLADNYHDGGEAELMHGFVEAGERRLPGNAFETGMGGVSDEFSQSQVMMYACSPLFQADMMLG